MPLDLLTVTFESEAPENISLDSDKGVQIDPHQSINVEGHVNIAEAIPEGEHTVTLHTLVDGRRIQELPITVNFTTNLVENPGFEEGFSSPDAWYIQSTATWEWVQDEVHSGQYAVTLFPGPNGTSDINTMEGIPVTPGKTYRVNFWAKNTSTNGGSFGVRRGDSSDNKIDYIWKEVQRDSDWIEYTFTFEPTNETESVRLHHRLEEGSDG